MSNFTELDMYLFGQATHYDIYKKMGAHPQTRRKKKGICFTLLMMENARFSVFFSAFSIASSTISFTSVKFVA